MTTERRRQIEDLFEAALEQGPERRAAWVAEACGADSELRADVEALLAAHARADGPLERPIVEVAAAVIAPEPADRFIGPYRVLRELGRGGMGVVYLAERDDGQFRRRVAVKVVRSGFDDGQIERRFLAERQILASLNHPNIAQLLDGGRTGGQLPYLVMEYVEGLPITTYCDRHQLDLRGRLALFQQVCAAVHHAHQNLVIHRDLKPSNIVVDSRGAVKLLDFGIAKLLNPALAPLDAPLTKHEHWVMTPDYASPEQVRGETVTTTSDVYALGVVLYELVAGEPPYRLTTRSPEQVLDVVCTRDPDRPSARLARGPSGGRRARLLRGDVDAIVMMALRKEPRRRYGSAEMLREDIQRYLDDRPVDARQGTRRYHAARFLRRHRVQATAAAVVTLSLVAGTGIALRQASVAVAERERAETALAEAEQITEFLMDLFRSGETDPSRIPGDVSVRDLLRRGVARVDALSGQPAVQARLLDAIGLMQHSIGDFHEAEQRLARAVTIRRTLGDPEALAVSLVHLSWVHRSRGEYDAARGLVGEALALRRRTLPPDHPDIADAVYELGFVAPNNTELQARYREALAIFRKTGARPERELRLLQGLATSLRRQGRFAEAIRSDREALALAERVFGPDDYRTGTAMSHLADQLRDLQGDLAAAEQLYRSGLLLVTRRFGDSHVQAVLPLNGLATVMARRGDHAGAEQLLRQVLRIRIGAAGERHPDVAVSLISLAMALDGQGRLAEAESTARQALEMLEATLGPRHPSGAGALISLAQILAHQGRTADADECYRQAVALTPNGTSQAEIRRTYGRVLTSQHRFAEAETELLRSRDLLLSSYPDGAHPNAVETERALMALYQAWNKPDLVERHRVPPGVYWPY